MLLRSREKALLKLAETFISFATEVTKFVNEKQRTRYQDGLHDLLTELKEAEDRWDDYTDIDVGKLESKLMIFMESYKNELKDN